MKAPLLFLFILLRLSCNSASGQSDVLQPQGIYTSSFIIDNITRLVTYYTPANYGSNDSALHPLLIFLHDDNSSANKSIKAYGNILHTKADSAGFVMMYPDAAEGSWHTKRNNADTVNDVGFISIMMEYFVQQYHCNPNEIYLLGVGSGGNMCYRLACESRHKVNAVATVDAVADPEGLKNCSGKGAIPAAEFKSNADIKAAINKALLFLSEHIGRK